MIPRPRPYKISRDQGETDLLFSVWDQERERDIQDWDWDFFATLHVGVQYVFQGYNVVSQFTHLFF